MKLILFIVQITTYGQFCLPKLHKDKSREKKVRILYNMRHFVNRFKWGTVYYALGTVFTGISLFYSNVLTLFL